MYQCQKSLIFWYLTPHPAAFAACLYCYLVCNYNKCSYLRLFVNREEMLDKIMKTANRASEDLTFEIGSNSDLVLENTITHNLEWTIERFAENEKGRLTFPTKFANVAPLLSLHHSGRVIFRMSVNPEKIIRQIELGTSPLNKRIEALNQMCEAGYPCGILIAPVIFLSGWQDMYSGLITVLSEKLSEKIKKTAFIEIIFMSYSFVHRKINEEAFPDAPDLYDKDKMQVRAAANTAIINRPDRRRIVFPQRACQKTAEYGNIIFQLSVSDLSPHIHMSEKEAANLPGYVASVRIHTFLSVGCLLLHIIRHTKFPPVFLP